MSIRGWLPDTDGAAIIAGRRTAAADGSSSRLFAGIDWASRTHAICVVDQSGAVRARFEIPDTGKTFTGLVKRLTRLRVGGVAIERGDGPLLEALVEAGLRGGHHPASGHGAAQPLHRRRGEIRHRRCLPARRRAAHRRASAGRPEPGQRGHRGAARPLAYPQGPGRGPGRAGQPAAGRTGTGLPPAPSACSLAWTATSRSRFCAATPPVTRPAG
jgi:hypothetical protein